MNKKLDTVNSESLIYEHEILKLTVLGGIKLEGLDRMRATLKIELKQSSVPPVRHNLDLYNDLACEKLIRRTAEKLEIGTSVIAASMAELTGALEEYRIRQIKVSNPKPYEGPKLTTEQQAAAEAFLKEPNLLTRTNKLIGISGVVGEQANRLIMYLIFTSRKREQPLHIVSLGSSGTGKTHLQEKVGELMPDEDRIEITTLSENAFYYFGQRELKNKLILIEDLDGAENVLYPLRELQSKKRISKTIAHKNSKGETRTIHLVVEGPVSVSGCTTREQIYEDNANRSFLIYLDESEEQDSRVMEYQRKLSAGKVNQEAEIEAARLMQNCQRILAPIKVVNPYAELLQIPKEVFKPRRTNNHYLQFIEAVTFYHQYQREQKVDKETGEIFIETTLEDIEEANRLMKQILLRKSDNLTGACRNHFERLKLYLLGEKGKQFTNREISRLFRIPLTTIKRYHLDLMLSGYLKTQKRKGSKAHYYQVVSYEEYNELQKLINTVLDESLEKLKSRLNEGKEKKAKSNQKNLTEKERPKSPVQPTKESGSINPQKNSGLEVKGQKPTRRVKRIRIKEKEKHTLKLIRELEQKQPGRLYLPDDFATITGRSYCTEARHLKTLWELEILDREWINRSYQYRLNPLHL
jgi:predicted transcriptional regulator